MSDLHENGGILLSDGRYLAAGGGSTNTWQLTVLSSTTIPDHASGTAGWVSGTNGMFGVCLDAAGSAAVASWNAVSGCAAANSVGWHDAQAGIETVATTPTGVNNVTAGFRFGLRTASNQPPGAYVAPVTFLVVAPMVP